MNFFFNPLRFVRICGRTPIFWPTLYVDHCKISHDTGGPLYSVPNLTLIGIGVVFRYFGRILAAEGQKNKPIQTKLGM